ncbi:sestrin-2-like [Macrobrachium rosenbergii]|uniref:sestrin-2-like n=1 Tax=Macrobrachium rosenbergii TaxID=79674 RepID=UPI0034D71FA7
MGHLVDQVEVAALETRVSKPPSTITTTTTAAAAAAAASAVASTITATASTSTTTTTATVAATTSASIVTATTAPSATNATVAATQVAGQSAQNLHPSQLRPQSSEQNQSKPKQRKLQFKLDDEGSPDKKPKERVEEDCLEEEESGWWAERVAMALGGMTEYRDAWYRSHAHLLHADGPLPHTWRLYIAALAVCRHEVSWLMQALLADFRNAGGDMRWTVGLQHAPPKLYALTAINNILAHRPWLLSPQHIEQLTRDNSWSLGELSQALCIMTHFHTLATFLHGCRLSILPSTSKKDAGQTNAKSGASNSKVSQMNIQARPKCLDSNPQNNNSNVDTGSKSKSPAVSTSEQAAQSYKHLTINPSYSYVDAICEDDARIPSFFVQEYNWQDHGYAMCSRLLGDVGAFFDDRFAAALNIVIPASKDQSQQSGNVDPLNNTLCGPLLAKALWNHVQWLLGIHHDDCDYTDLNKRLDPHVRDFVKKSCCFPETLADSNSSPVTTNSVQTSMVEMSVIVMEARLQSELLYALRAIMLHHC